MPSKEVYINQLFDSIANYYDFANTVLSFGRDRYWRRFTARLVKRYGARQVLDVCSGTGMLALAIAQEITDCKVIGVDFSEKMLWCGKSNLSHYPESQRINLQPGNAMNLLFPDASFDCATLAFSLRNVDDISQVLREMQRVVRPGGAVITLELSKPEDKFFRVVYYWYFYRLVPKVGKLIYGKPGPYDYLPNSLTDFPERKELEDIYHQVGFKQVKSYPLTGGIVAVHVGEK